jgi:UDP-glucose 4-epimerase
MKILVTGITGRIGAEVAQALVAAGHQVRGLVWLNDRRLDRLEGLPLELVEGSLVEQADVERAVDGVDVVCHLGAAFQGGGPFNHAEYFEINVRGVYNMLEAANRQSTKPHFFFASSDALYEKYLPGGIPEPIQEDTFPLRPKGLYAVTKHAGEALCWGYWRSFGLPVTVFRFAMTLGGAEILNYPQFYIQHFLKTYTGLNTPEAEQVRRQLEQAFAEHGEDCLVLARDEQGRSYKKHIAHAQDIVLGFLAAMGKAEAVGEAFQLAAPAPFTWQEAVPYLAEKLGKPFVEVRLVGTAPTHYEFDLSKGRRLLGYQPTYDIRKMIDEALLVRVAG